MGVRVAFVSLFQASGHQYFGTPKVFLAGAIVSLAGAIVSLAGALGGVLVFQEIKKDVGRSEALFPKT